MASDSRAFVFLYILLYSDIVNHKQQRSSLDIQV